MLIFVHLQPKLAHNRSSDHVDQIIPSAYVMNCDVGPTCVAVMGVGSQQNTFVTVNIIYWGASPERRHLGLYDSTHTFHQALEEIISQRIALKPMLFIHSYDYIQ